jgi:uncharacterized cupredoxin-like copper-binding protein/mono/diheme cytochrome c family protein
VGAVQKLATTVIVGLVGLATLLVVYLANEPNRRAAEATEQEHVAIERGVQTYIQNCLICHGPAGEGLTEPGLPPQGEHGRIGLPLGGSTEAGLAATARNQSEVPAERQKQFNMIVKTLQDGRGRMPAFGRGAEGGAVLNDEQINELALMIQNVDWDHVYNESVAYAGGYPTPPPPPPSAAQTAPAAPAEGEGAAPAAAFTVESHDIYFAPTELTIPADQDVVIALPNVGAAPHNFAIDELNISVDQAAGGMDYTTTINAPEGTYEYYCNVPGHREAGMVGTLTADPNAELPAAAAAPAAPAEGEAAAAQGAAPAYTVTSGDIYFDPTAITIPAASEVTLSLPNEGAAPHNFSIDALDISVDLAAGETDATATVNAAAGDYEYYCNVPGHREAGMVGTLTADPNAAPPAAAAPAEAAPAEAAQGAAPAEGADAAASFTVTSHDIFFDPTELTIPADTEVTVSLPNVGAAPHNFAIDELGISVDQAAGGMDYTASINAPAGTYEYYCNVPGHREAGMVGTLTAE